MSSTQEIIKQIIQKLYRESMSRFNFHINQYGDNGHLEAEDGTFLGKFSNKYDSESIFNQYGNYGSKYSATSIFNQYGNYGSKYSALSPVNLYTATPPKVFWNGQYIGRLTVNKYVAGALPTDLFLFYVMYHMGVLDDRLDDFIDLIS